MYLTEALVLEVIDTDLKSFMIHFNAVEPHNTEVCVMLRLRSFCLLHLLL